MAYKGLLFSFAEMEKEIENLRISATAFLERDTFERVIPEWKNQLETFRRQAPGTTLNWEIFENNPFQTKVSDGKFDRRSGIKVFGRISAKWQIALPYEAKGRKKGTLGNQFLLNGLASTRISIWQESEGGEKEIARWTVEIGDDASPGCHFHSQIPLAKDGGGMFPKALSVPRLPTLLVTPMDAVDFVLSELFQSEWHAHASRNTAAQKLWGACQRRRLGNLLNWYLECIEASSAPWISLKQEKPEMAALSK